MRVPGEPYCVEVRRTLMICFFAFFYNGLMSMTLGSVLPDIKAAYGLSDTQSGLMLAGHSAGNLAASLLSGLVLLRLGQRRAITLLSLSIPLGLGLVLWTGDALWLAVAFGLCGAGRASISNFNNGTVNRVTGGSPTASNLLHSCFAMGAICAPLVFLGLSRLAGWHAAIATVALLGGVVSVAFSRLRLAEDRPARDDRTQRSLAFLRDPAYLLLAGMMFFYLCAEYSITGWLVTYLQSRPALLQQFANAGGDGQAALQAYSQAMATLLWAVILGGRLLSAALARRHPQKRLMLMGSVGVLLFFVLLLLGRGILSVTLSVAGLGFCLSGICPMIYSDASAITNRYPLATSGILAIGSVGGIVMPALVGALADAYGFTGGMSAILVGVAALLLLAVLNDARGRRVDKPV